MSEYGTYTSSALRQRLVEREPEEARILADDRSGENQEDVVACLLGNVLLREQRPEVTIARVLLHRANALLHARRSPVVRGEHQQPRCLRFAAIEIPEIARRGLRRRVGIEALIVRVELPQSEQWPGAQAVLTGCFRHQLPHALGNSEPGFGTDRLRTKITLLQRHVKELRGHVVLEHDPRNQRRQILCARLLQRVCEALVRAPDLDVALHFVDEALRHRDLALAEDARHAQDQPVLGRQAVIQHAELLEQRVVLGRHLGELRAPFLRLRAMRRIRACLDLLLEPRELQLDGLHVVEDLLGEPARTLELDVLVDADGDGYQQQPERACDHRPVPALLLALDGAEGAADHHRAIAGGSAGLRVEVMRDDVLHRLVASLRLRAGRTPARRR